MKMFQLIVGCLLALGFFGVGIYGLMKKWKGKHIATCLVASAAMFLISLDWVQGFVQTQVFTSLLRASKEYGEKLNDFQKTTGEMKVELAKHQGEINQQQQIIVEQQTRIADTQAKIDGQQARVGVQQQRLTDQQAALDKQEHALQEMSTELAGTQERISNQQKRIEDVEFLAQNLYSKTVFENISGADSNKVSVAKKGENVHLAFFRLDHVPVINSVQAIFCAKDAGQSPLKPRIGQIDNVIFTNFKGGWKSWADGEFALTYVNDTRKTNTWKSVEVRGDRVFFDGQHIPVNWGIEQGAEGDAVTRAP